MVASRPSDVFSALVSTGHTAGSKIELLSITAGVLVEQAPVATRMHARASNLKRQLCITAQGFAQYHDRVSRGGSRSESRLAVRLLVASVASAR